MGTQILNCHDCGKDFAFPPGEAEAFARLEFPPPVRCRSCRKENRELKGAKRQLHPQVRITIADVVRQHLGDRKDYENAQKS
jgi:hypothetical protein